LTIEDLNESYSVIKFEESDEEALDLRLKLMQDLSVFVDGYKFSPKYRAGIWDGKKYYFKMLKDMSMQIPKGLAETILKKYKDQVTAIYSPRIIPQHYSKEDLENFIKTKNIPFPPYDYQFDAVLEALNNPRRILVASTSSGKSLIIYLLMTFFEHIGKKGLLIVPNVGLCEQMQTDFLSYNMTSEEADEKLHVIFSGKEKTFRFPMTVTTWQSAILMNNSHFDQLDYVLVDECLHPDTLVDVPNNKVKIKDLKNGDLVLTRNEETGVLEYKPIKKIHKNISKEKMFEVKTENGKVMRITGNHKVFTGEVWKRVDELEIGDNILELK